MRVARVNVRERERERVMRLREYNSRARVLSIKSIFEKRGPSSLFVRGIHEETANYICAWVFEKIKKKPSIN